MKNWNGKPYHSLDYMLRERFGEKVVPYLWLRMEQVLRS